MTPALRLDDRSNRAARSSVLAARSRYSVVGRLRGTGRAALAICLPAGADRVSDVVLVKSFSAGVLGRAEAALPDELELASRLEHENVVQTLGIGSDEGGDFIISEYLEGITLRGLLEWLHARAEKLPDVAVARVLLSVFAAVEHAAHHAVTPSTRALARQPTSADDVFITCAGDVKLLGFKPCPPPRPAPEERNGMLGLAAVDALLSTHRSPELSAVLAGIGTRLPSSSVLGLWQITRAIGSWKERSVHGDGRAELAAVMAQRLPEGRAARRAQLEAACARVLQRRLARGVAIEDVSVEPVEEAAPVSGYRRTGTRRTGARTTLIEQLQVGAAAGSAQPWLSGREEPELQVTRSHRPLELDVLASKPAPRRRSHIWAAGAALSGALVAFAVHHSLRPWLAGAAATASAAPVVERPTALEASGDGTGPSEVPGAPDTSLRSTAGHWQLPANARRAGGSGTPVVSHGYLTLDTTPRSSVSLGAVDLGQTPLVKLELPAGQHTLDLSNGELGISSRVVVNVVAGVTMIRRIDLAPPQTQQP
jgi:hypothetical protein